MGFGWFLVGYFFVSVVSIYSPVSFVMLAGYPMMIFGLWQLAPYQRYFRVAFYFSFVSLPFALYYACYGLGKMGFSMPLVDATFATVEWVYFAFTLLFTALWLFAAFSLCRELAHEKLLSWAVRSLIFFAAAQVLELIARMPIGFIETYSGYFALPAVLLRLISIFMNIYFLYLCYRYICPEGEEFSHLQADAEIQNAKDVLEESKK